jgi:ATP-dependent Clp protease ATP-binding subunit ClpA
MCIFTRNRPSCARADAGREGAAAVEADIKPTVITIEDIAKVVEMWTGIPVQRISESESEKLLHLEDRLHERVIGQEGCLGTGQGDPPQPRRIRQKA